MCVEKRQTCWNLSVVLTVFSQQQSFPDPSVGGGGGALSCAQSHCVSAHLFTTDGHWQMVVSFLRFKYFCKSHSHWTFGAGFWIWQHGGCLDFSIYSWKICAVINWVTVWVSVALFSLLVVGVLTHLFSSSNRPGPAVAALKGVTSRNFSSC